MQAALPPETQLRIFPSLILMVAQKDRVAAEDFGVEAHNPKALKNSRDVLYPSVYVGIYLNLKKGGGGGGDA